MVCDGQHYNCPDCYKVKLRTVQFEGADERAMEVRKRDRQFDKDAAAYKRLRADGLQPKGVNQSAMAEKLADHRSEIMLGRSLRKEERSAVNKNLGAV